MKVGDPYTALVDNKTPGGLNIIGTIAALTDEHVIVDTQFGVQITLPRPVEEPIIGS